MKPMLFAMGFLNLVVGGIFIHAWLTSSVSMALFDLGMLSVWLGGYCFYTGGQE